MSFSNRHLNPSIICRVLAPTVPVLAFSLVGCTNQIDKSLESWVGHDVNELIASWGPPSRSFSDGKGGQIFVYTETRSWTQPGTSTTTASVNSYGNSAYGHATTVYQPASVQGYDSYRMFWIDNAGNIYSWAWRGL
jgi:hypothetical protein